MINAILFDLDGTLADTAPDLGHALNAQLILHRRQPLALESIRPHASKGARGLLKLGFDLDPENAEFQAMREEYLKLYETHFTRNAELFPGVTELLDGLDALHVRWAIVTNKPSRFTLPLAEILGLSARATVIVCGDSCAQPKPHPEPLLLACRRMGVAPQAGYTWATTGATRRRHEPPECQCWSQPTAISAPKRTGVVGTRKARSIRRRTC
jgi:2-phosphoglycolate phosphatase